MRSCLFILMLCPFWLFSQSYFSQTDFDLGEIDQLNEDVIDLNLSNQTDEDIYLLRIEANPRVTIKYTSKSLRKGSAQLLRLKLNPTKTGKFKERVNVYLSNNKEAVALTIKGDVKGIPKNSKTACPDFSGGQKAQMNHQLFKQQQNGERSDFFIQITAFEEKLEPKTTIAQQGENPRERLPRQKVEKVRKTPEERRNSPSVLEILFGNQDSSSTAREVETEKTDETTLNQKEEPANPDLLSEEFKPNNVVFLIDASTSMREDEKMDLLKLAMIQLLEPLRSIDYLSIVTYSGEAKVLMSPTSGIQKQEIQKSIENIVADGSTQATKGIKRAIQLGNSNFIEGGNNQIILATDGAFDIGERNESLRRKIKNTSKQGLRISVLGIKNAKWTNKSLKEIVELGQGNYLKINSHKDVTKVLEEVKKQSRE